MENMFTKYKIDDFSLPQVGAVNNSTGAAKIKGSVNPTYRSKMTSLQNKYNNALLKLRSQYEKELTDFNYDVKEMDYEKDLQISDFMEDELENSLSKGMARASYKTSKIGEQKDRIAGGYNLEKDRRQAIKNMLTGQYLNQAENNFSQTFKDIGSIRTSRLEKMMAALAKLKKPRTRTVYITRKPNIDDFKNLKGRKTYSF